MRAPEARGPEMEQVGGRRLKGWAREESKPGRALRRSWQEDAGPQRGGGWGATSGVQGAPRGTFSAPGAGRAPLFPGLAEKLPEVPGGCPP